MPLTTIMKEDPLKSTLVRVAELGVLQVTDPKAMCLIMNTEQTRAT